MQPPQHFQFFPDPSLPPGQGDLEALERLKEFIKNNQHEFFRAVPRPSALLSLYKGPLPSLVPSHPEQTSSSLHEKSTSNPSGLGFEKLSSSGFASDGHHSRIPPAVQGVPMISSQSGDSVPPRTGFSSETVRTPFPLDSSSLVDLWLLISFPPWWILLIRVAS
jgi:hypothetical protein